MRHTLTLTRLRLRPRTPLRPHDPHTTSIRSNHTPAPSPSSSATSSKTLRRYLPLPLLRELSTRTGAPIPSLAVSFLILHELTAVLPVVGLYFIFDALGAGQSLVRWIRGVTTVETESRPNSDADGQALAEPHARSNVPGGMSWDWRESVQGWYEEGEKRVERVGRRYGFWGFEKGSKRADANDKSAVMEMEGKTSRAAEGIANAISAYVVVKAALPFRIAFSIGAAPAFARFALEPIRRIGQRLTKRNVKN